MQLRRPLPQGPHRGEVGTDRFRGQAGKLAVQESQRPSGDRGDLNPRVPQDLLRVAGQVVQRVLPGVPLVGDEPLQHGEAVLLFAVHILQRSGHGRHVGEPRFLAQAPPDLDFRVRALLDLAEHLEDQLVSEDDRGIGLLGLHEAWLRRELRLPTPQMVGGRRGRRLHQARATLETSPPGNTLHQRSTEGLAGERLVEDDRRALVPRGLEPGNHGVGMLPADPRGLLA